MTAEELHAGFRARALTPSTVVEALVSRIDRLDRQLSAIVTLDVDGALTAATESDRRYAVGRPRSRFDGVPILVKDNIDTAGLRTTYGSAVYRAHTPASDAEVVARLRRLGMVILAKTNLHEFAWGITGVNPHYGTARNPHDHALVPGGSSSGSAVGVAAGYAPLALGTDTGGSGRIPAAFCGIVGFKPSFGVLPVAGTFPLAPSLDQVSLLGRSPYDVAVLLRLLAPFPSRCPGPAWASRMSARRIGVAWVERLPPARRVRTIDAIRRWASSRRLTVRQIELPSPEEAFDVYRILQAVEALEGHRARGLFPERSGCYGVDVRARLEAATAITPADVAAAAAARRRIRAAISHLFSEVDVVVTPTVGVEPWPIDEVLDAERDAARRKDAMAFTVPWSLTGLPACAIPLPATLSDLGSVQIVGPPSADSSVLQAADTFRASLADHMAR